MGLFSHDQYCSDPHVKALAPADTLCKTVGQGQRLQVTMKTDLQCTVKPLEAVCFSSHCAACINTIVKHSHTTLALSAPWSIRRREIMKVSIKFALELIYNLESSR